MTTNIELGCACGSVHLEVERGPIVSVECCCNSCRAAAERLQRLPGARPLVDEHGATRFVFYRKDRIRFVAGADRLKEFRLSPQAKTRRVIASCCNTPVFLEFKGGHWLSLYGHLWPEGALPPLELRTMTADLPAGATLPGDVPNAGRQTLSLFGRLLSAWIAMGFRSPEIALANGAIDA